MLDALHEHLEAISGLTDLVSTRIYRAKAPQGAARPYVVYHRTSGFADHYQGGDSGMATHRVTIEAWADTLGAARDVLEQIRLKLDAFRGAMGSTNTAYVHIVALTDEFDEVLAPEDGSDVGLHNAVHRYRVVSGRTASTASRS